MFRFELFDTFLFENCIQGTIQQEDPTKDVHCFFPTENRNGWMKVIV